MLAKISKQERHFIVSKDYRDHITQLIESFLDQGDFDLNKLVSIAFEDAANFSGNLRIGVRRKLTNISSREIPTNDKNNFPVLK